MHAADWMAIWLDSQGVPPPEGVASNGRAVDIAGAVAEERAISTAANYVPPVYTAPRDPGLPYVDTSAAPGTPVPVKKSAVPLVIGAGLLAWLALR